MVDPLGKPSDKADRPPSPVPLGCGKLRRLHRCAPRLRSVNYDLRRTPRIRPHFARNAVHEGLNQRFLSLQLFFQPYLDQGLVGHVAPVRCGLDPFQHVLGQPQ